MTSALGRPKVLPIIMGGGRGTRLFPLTRERSKPAVPLGGKYRLVDIPISNCINSGLQSIYLLTQFNSASLHRHVSQSFKFDHFSGGFVEILAAEQTFKDSSWYEGTADAVRKNLVHFTNLDFDYALILSGDQLYRMDFRTVLTEHVAKNAEVTIATKPVSRQEAQELGILEIDEETKILRFFEKPTDPELLDSLKLPAKSCSQHGIDGSSDFYLASMGIYMFNRETLFTLLNNTLTDFGKNVIPEAIKSNRVFGTVFKGYWADIGTIGSFFEANLDLTSELPRFNFFDMSSPVFTRPRFLPGSKINGAQIDHAVVSDGCILNQCTITRSIVGIRSLVKEGSSLTRSIIMGSDYYEDQETIAKNQKLGIPPVGIGQKTRIENAIIDKNARIGSDCLISPLNKPENGDYENYFIRDGIVIIPKNGVIRDGTEI